MYLLVRYRVRFDPDEHQQQIERFRRETDLYSLTPHHARADVDHNRAHYRRNHEGTKIPKVHEDDCFRTSRNRESRKNSKGQQEESLCTTGARGKTRIEPTRCTALPAGATFPNRAATARPAARALTRRARRR